jgi:hypothetical protein
MSGIRPKYKAKVHPQQDAPEIIVQMMPPDAPILFFHHIVSRTQNNNHL